MASYEADSDDHIVPARYNPGGGLPVGGYAPYLTQLQYVPAPDAIGGQPAEESDSVFRCPEGQSTLAIPAGNVPATRTDERTLLGWRSRIALGSRQGAQSVTWYGANSHVSENAFTVQFYNAAPMTDVVEGFFTKTHRKSEIRDTTGVPMLFDGIFLLQGQFRRVGLRHGGESYANASFADGHVEQMQEKDYPDGVVSGYSPLSGTPEYGAPPPTTNFGELLNFANGIQWRLDQPY